MELFLHNIIVWLDSSKYVLLFLGCLIEGGVVMIVSGFLLSLGQFDLLPLYLTLLSGDFTADILWYSLGRFGTRHAIFKFGHYIGLTQSIFEKIESLFNRYHQKILIITKLTSGFGFVVIILMVAGMFKVPFKNYALIVFGGGVIWIAFLLSIGYFLGNIFLIIPRSLKIIFIAFSVILLVFAFRWIKQFMAKKEYI